MKVTTCYTCHGTGRELLDCDGSAGYRDCPEGCSRPAARRAAAEQPAPVTNDKPAVWDLVVDDMRARDELGQRKYGTRLQPRNGRDVLRDAYEEALDLCVYLRQAIEERGQ